MDDHDHLASLREDAIGDGEIVEAFDTNANSSPRPGDTGEMRYPVLSRAPSRREDTKILCRVDQPIQDIVIKPHITIPKKTNDELQFSESDLLMTWYRYSIRTMCSSERCIFGEDFGNNLVPLSCQCVTCLKYGNEEHSSFCCVKCMLRNWKDHKNKYHKNLDQNVNTELCVQSSKDEYISRFVKCLSTPQKKGVWEVVYQGPYYRPTERDIGHQLKMVLSVPNKNVEIHSEYTSPPVVAYPPFPVLRTIFTQPLRTSSPTITICSYNILAEAYATSQQYSYCPKWALLWNYRKTRLLREIEGIKADIYCFQEVQQDSFDNFWAPKMSELGYEGYFARKTRASHTPNKVDGCAVFYNKKMFHLVGKYTYSYDEEVHRSNYFTDEQKNRMLRNNISQILFLEMNIAPHAPRICVCNNHIFWNTEYKDVKLWQVYRLLNYLQNSVGYHNAPILLCGDFNSEPTSAVYELISKRKVDSSNPDLNHDPLHILPHSSELVHMIPFLSAYKSFFGTEPKYTNYTGNYQGCLDYIWFTSQPAINSGVGLHLVGASPMPSEELLRSHRDLYLPNPQYPSDHLPLIAKFELFIQG